MREWAFMSEPQIVVLNGPSGVGKTTVGRLLASRSENGVCIVGDSLREFVVTRDSHRPSGLAFRAAAALVEVYADAGFDLIIFDFVFEGPEHLEPFRAALAEHLDFTLVTLWVDAEVIKARKQLRGRGDENAAERVGHRIGLMRKNLHELGEVVDADGPANEVASKVETYLTL